MRDRSSLTKLCHSNNGVFEHRCDLQSASLRHSAGNMGLPMAKCVAASHELHIFSRDASKAQRVQKEHLPSCTIHKSVSDLASSVDVLVASLNTADVSRAVLLDQAVPAAAADTVLVDTSTVPRQLSLECERACADAGLHFLDAPVSGGPAKAADGTLSVMVGGSSNALNKAQAVLGCLGTVFHMGGPGTGTAAKLVNQLLVGVHSVAACEALLMAERLGIEARSCIMCDSEGLSAGAMQSLALPLCDVRLTRGDPPQRFDMHCLVQDTGQLLQLLQSSFGYSKVLERNGAAVQAAQQAKADGSAPFANSDQPIRNMVKDMGIVGQVCGLCSRVMAWWFERR